MRWGYPIAINERISFIDNSLEIIIMNENAETVTMQTSFRLLFRHRKNEKKKEKKWLN